MVGYRRTIVPEKDFHSEQIAPGVTFRRLYPGGMAGPNRECYNDTPGGQQWSEAVMLGSPGDALIDVPARHSPAAQPDPADALARLLDDPDHRRGQCAAG